jgi:hypothetical protein
VTSLTWGTAASRSPKPLPHLARVNRAWCGTCRCRSLEEFTPRHAAKRRSRAEPTLSGRVGNLRFSVRTGASCALDEAGCGCSARWSPREDSNLHCRVRSPVVSCISLRGDGPHGASLSWGRYGRAPRPPLAPGVNPAARAFGGRVDCARPVRQTVSRRSAIHSRGAAGGSRGCAASTPWLDDVTTLGVEPSPPGLQPGASTGLA